MESLNLLLSYVQSAVIFMLVLTVLVAVHELGHFWFARAFGMHVDAFGVMMGGLRATRLDGTLGKPLVSSRLVGALYVGAALLTALSGVLGQSQLFLVGLASLAFPLPLWVVTRLSALYHRPALEGLKPLGYSYLFALGALFATTRFQGVTPTQFLGLMFFGSLAGVLFAYYYPVLKKPEDSPMGEGVIHMPNGDPVDVRFRPLWARKDKHGTEFSLLLLPLGGFAAIKAMHPKDDGSETQVPGGFYSKPPFARFLVLLAGPLFSVLFGVILLTGVFTTMGLEKPVDKPILGPVVKGMPADKAGLRAGDRIVSVDGKPVNTWYELISNVRDKTGELAVVADRKGEAVQAVLVPERDKQPTPVLGPNLEPSNELRIQSKIGAMPSLQRVPMPVGEAFGRAVTAPLRMAASIGGVALQPSRAKDEFGGPASIATLTHDAASQGFDRVLTLAAMLSISLGIMNLLPVPPLDGGQMVVAFVEMLRGGRRLSIQVQNTVSTVGMFLVMALIVSVLMLDVNKFIGGGR